MATATQTAPLIPFVQDDDLFTTPVYENPKGLLKFRPTDYEKRTKTFTERDPQTGQMVDEERSFVIINFVVTDVLDKPSNRAKYVGQKISDSIGTSLGPKAGATLYAKAFLGAEYDPTTVRAKFRLSQLIAEGREVVALVKEEPKGDRKWPVIVRESLQPAE